MSQGMMAVSSPATGPGIWRTTPSWCDVFGVSQAVAIFGSSACTPMSNEEMKAAQMADLAYVCRNAVDKDACQGMAKTALQRSNAQVDAAGDEIPLGESVTGACELEAATVHPTLSSIFGPANVCRFMSGSLTGTAGDSYSTYIFIAAGVVLLIGLLKRR
jgi:hypothetical protein